ncbi:hypothetical protein AB4072_10005 [Microvirga sp. 2MCAF38]|uniref:hypothetical protein n=1 Tax=Microvirga sp. 2MCAF38 TaxID=3232989 RepID=UPI003F9A16B0
MPSTETNVAETNVLAFRRAQKNHTAPASKSLIEAVYAAGSIAVRADDLPTKTAATMLQAFGLIVIDSVGTDGTLKLLRKGEARQARDRPWRLSKPSFSGEVGVPDANGAFTKHP